MSGNFQLALHLFLQLAALLASCRIAGRVMRSLGQPQVVGEMVAGVLLGPSLLGWVAPAVGKMLFPTTLSVAVGEATREITHPSMTILYALAQLGLVLYMFLIGMQLDTELLAQHSGRTAGISAAGILIPMALGGALGVFLAGNHLLFPHGIAGWQAALVVASAMCVTAFPVLARILHEAGLVRTRLGSMALGAAAFDDAAAWCLLACVLASIRGSIQLAAVTILGGIAYALVMYFIGRPLFRWFDRVTERDRGVKPETLTLALLVLMLCAWITDVIGIHAVFGAFTLGLAMPRGAFIRGVVTSLEGVTVALLVPIFFVYAGLGTKLGLLVQPELFWIAVGTTALAFLCKGGGCVLAARLGGLNWREATEMGVLMNAHGMMELILAGIALERGLITPGMYTILVLMAIITTLAATPLFNLVRNSARRPEPPISGELAS